MTNSALATRVLLLVVLLDLALAAVFLHIVILFRGARKVHGISSLILSGTKQQLQRHSSCRTVQAKVAVEEGVRYTAEPIIAPIVFGLAYAFLLYNMREILYV